MKKWAGKTDLPIHRLGRTAGLGLSKFYNWKDRYGVAKLAISVISCWMEKSPYAEKVL